MPTDITEDTSSWELRSFASTRDRQIMDSGGVSRDKHGRYPGTMRVTWRLRQSAGSLVDAV
jgi:hypothetical protein